ncbi:MAG: hypothetical protein A3B25_00320 [Candidatus Ryanbacteria bacterium RIFCSPLOWO2_01_FULL_48_26]|uniref:Uncharacterized protein n=1 Tax=Candidatus Ryanbacteria bacterium RIFCSPLOWO2_01_FULL_48_26 TaxID=1802126 RepID=A0A1G2GS40_9BACT|nr:MAG: hypothetical protein A3B25_00320 [Candidatus Ryanbacteria bacterium RIFCSPLOWO2_01_FULL_48_26]
MTDVSKLPPQVFTDKNLINQIKKSPQFIEGAIYKPLIIDALSILSALWFGYAYSRFLVGGSGQAFLASLGIFSILSTIQVFFTKAFRRRILVIILQTICILVPFYGYDTMFLAVAAGIYMFFVICGELLAYGELENCIEIRFFKIARTSLKKLTTALVLLMVILYLPQWDEKKAFIPREGFKSLYAWTTNIIRNFYPGIDFNSTFISFTRSFARSGLQGSKEFDDLSLVNKEVMVEQVSVQIATNISKSLDAAIFPEDSMADVFYNSILKLLANLKDRFKQSFLLIWALSVFFIIRGIGVIFYWIASLVSFILYELLLTSGFVHIVGITKTHEVIDF